MPTQDHPLTLQELRDRAYCHACGAAVWTGPYCGRCAPLEEHTAHDPKDETLT